MVTKKSSTKLLTLAIDIGGTGIKAVVIDENDKTVSEYHKDDTPHPATPEAMLTVITELAKGAGQFDRVSAGFPGVVRNGVVETAPNLNPAWKGVDIQGELTKLFKKPVRVLNDAAVQGYGSIQGKGVELVITLGTGVGSSLFVDGRLVPNLELGHHPFRRGATYEDQLGKFALEKVGKKKWNARLEKAIAIWSRVFNYDCLYLGGGNSKKIGLTLPANVKTVANSEGLYGGLALWQEHKG